MDFDCTEKSVTHVNLSNKGPKLELARTPQSISIF